MEMAEYGLVAHCHYSPVRFIVSQPHTLIHKV